MKSYEFIVSGRVQGVGYRANVSQIVKKLGLNGNVRNLSNGDVKVILQLEEDQLALVKDYLAVPRHPFMKIKSIKINELNLDKIYEDFKIIY